MVRINRRNYGSMLHAIVIVCILTVAEVEAESVTSATECNSINAEENNLTTPDCEVTEGSSCDLSCKKGYKTDRDTAGVTARCTQSGWNPAIPTCQAITCQPWALLRNQVYKKGNCGEIRRVNDSCRITCAKGYKFQGIQEIGKLYGRTCKLGKDRVSASWGTEKQTPDCEAITCPPYTPGGNQVIKSGDCGKSSPWNTSCQIGCAVNFKFESPNESKLFKVECQLSSDDASSASWQPVTSIPECQEVTCSPLEIPDSDTYVKSCQGISVDTECSITCNPAYKLRGSSSRRWTTSCKLQQGGISAEWADSNLPTCQARTCTETNIDASKNYIVKSCPRGKTVGSVCPVSCKVGYRFDEEIRVANISCILSTMQQRNVAVWDLQNAPACKRIKCGAVSLRNHEYYETKRCPGDRGRGSKCVIKCQLGYTINSTTNEDSISCGVKDANEFEAEWKVQNAPTCKEITCFDIASANREKVRECGTSINTTCTVRCQRYYRFSSSSWGLQNTLQSKCVMSKTGTAAEWKLITYPAQRGELQSTPGCEEIRCAKTKMPGNYKQVTCRSASINSFCELQCMAGHKFSDGATSKTVFCTLNDTTKSSSWPTPECIKIKCRNITASIFSKPVDNLKEKNPEPGSDCLEGASCSITCAKGYSFSDETSIKELTCNTISEKWEPLPESVGLCEPIITGRGKCEYWVSGVTTNSINDAEDHCHSVLGPNATLAMPKTAASILIGRLEQLTLVGAQVSEKGANWNDETRLKNISGIGSGSCVSISKSGRFWKSTCRFKPFMCERPKANGNLCNVRGRCSDIGNCTAVGCSFRCSCPDMFFGRDCQNGPFTSRIKEMRQNRFRIYIKNNAEEKAEVSLFVNGLINYSFTLMAGKEVKEVRRLMSHAERNNFISLVANLVRRPETPQSKCLKIFNPVGIDRVNITKDECDPTVLKILWEGFANGTGNSTTFSVYIGSEKKETTHAGSWVRISGLTRKTPYKIRVVPALKGCSKPSNFELRHVKTPYGIPDVSNVTKMDLVPEEASTKNCSIKWNLIKPNNSGGYTVRYVQEARFIAGNMPSNVTNVNVPQFTKTVSFRARPNSIYRISVGTKAPAGCEHVPIKWSKNFSGCETGTSAPDVIPDLITVSPLSRMPTVELKQVNERNGPVSCYLVIVHVTNTSINSSEVSTTLDKLKQSNDSVDVGDSYVAAAVKRFEGSQTLRLGDGQMSCCNLRNVSISCTPLSRQGRQKRAATSPDEVHGENRLLDPNQKYQHYVLISTPRDNGDNPILTASPLSDVWNIPPESVDERNGNNPLSIAIPIVVVLLLGIIIVGIVVFRRRSSEPKERDRVPPRANQESLSIEAGEFIDMEENSDSIIDRELSGYSLRLVDLFHAINTKRENEDMQFLVEFRKSITDAVKQCNLTYEIAHLRVNQPKNRFKNIVPYDRSRVALSNVPGVEFSDYINASYIDGYSHPRKFIATQGPKPETMGDFWRMVSEQNCRVIVMLTNLKERMKVKCAQYWPEKDESANHNGITVTLHETISFGDFVKRRIVVTRNQESIDVVQFHFVAWPDHGVPSTTSSLLRFHDYVVSAQPANAGPIVVHCSAGVGRTGTFIALNYLNNQIMEMNEINVAVVVGRMRARRPEMVQTLEQYILIHKLVLELYQFGDTDRDTSEFNSAIQDLKRGTLNIAQEFEMLNYFMPLDTSQDYGKKESNARFNRNPSIVPYDHNRAFIQMEPNDREVPYYNASIVASYDRSNQCIAAQSPCEQSVEFFWRTVLNNDVDAIVALGAKNEPGMLRYWPEVSKSERYGIITVRTLEKTTDKGLTERVLEVSSKTSKITMLQICFDGWQDHSVPSGSETVLEIISKIEKHYQTLSAKTKRTTLVHCSDGSGRTGTFLAISNLIERLKNENRVDVFRMAKDLRDLRPGMIETEEQYSFCYHAVSGYLQLFDLYGNFQ